MSETKTYELAAEWSEVLPARGRTAFPLAKGQLLRIEDLEGQQGVDLLCYNLDDLREKFWAAHSAKLSGTIYLTTGHSLYSSLARPMLTIIEDTVGVNDLICGSCSSALDAVRYGEDKANPGCMENFEAAIEPWGLTRNDIPMCFNLFLRYPVEVDGTVSIDHPAPSSAGDYMVLEAEMDLLVVISNCPQEFNPCAGFSPTPLGISVRTP